MKYRSILLIVVCALPVHDASAVADDSSPRNDQDSNESLIKATPFAARDSAQASGRFQLLEAEQTGIDFAHYWDPPDEKFNELVDKAVTGGGELEPDDDLLQDRLYLNDGSGDFTKAGAGVLPDVRVSGSCVAVCDFDRDGDLDLFVGGRCVPGAYPTTPRSMLLRNDSQPGEPLLVDVAENVAPELSKSGMVTGAAWSDIDNDGWIDLIVTHDWGPIKLFKNQQGRLVDRTNEAELADRLGWWNGIAGGDVDRDGDMDFVVTNYGLNSRYQASAEQPVEIYYGDFDGTSVNRIVEAEHCEGRLLPIRGKHATQKAIAYLRERFPTFHEYASATLEEIHSKERLAAALKRTVNCLESGVLLNDGRGAFSFRPFPRLAQISPSFGVALADADGDGLLDVYLVQNFLGSQRETGPLDGGMSLLLRGDGRGDFAPVWPNESGLIVPGAAASLIAADISGDGMTDFLVGINNDELTAFEGRRANGGKRLTVQLDGPPGNPEDVGSQVSLEYDDGSMHVAEIRSGEGYLSQGPRQAVLVPPPNRRPVWLHVRWSDGTNSSHELSPNDGPVVTVSYR